MHFGSYGKLDNKGIKHYLDISKELIKREHQKTQAIHCQPL
jgi:hypothetical protein